MFPPRSPITGRFRFADRREAGMLLAADLERRQPVARTVVLGLPRGGVPVAAVVAERLHAPLGVITVGKIRTPGRPELAMGAVAVRGPLDETVRTDDRCDDDVFVTEQVRVLADTRAKDAEWRGPDVDIEGAGVIAIDDGLATGATMQAALVLVRRSGAARVIAAVPVASAGGLRSVRPLADAVVCVHEPREFHSVSQHYRDFAEVDDAEVHGDLARAAWREL